MANRFFNNIIDLFSGSKAKASDIEAHFNLITTGFDGVQTEMDLKAPKASPAFTGTVLLPATETSGTATFSGVVINGTLDMNAGTTSTITGLASPIGSTDAAHKGYVDAQIAGVLGSAPGVLDTLDELAAALGDDANFAVNTAASIAAKLPKSGGTMTGTLDMGGQRIVALPSPSAGTDAVTLDYVSTLYGSTAAAAVSASAAAADRVQTGLDRAQTGLDRTAAASSVAAAALEADASAASAAAAEESAIAAAASAASIAGGPVASVNGRTGVVTDVQDALVSGINIKTVGGVSLLGPGDVAISAPVPEVKTPTNTTPAATATGVMNTATLTGSTYGTLYGIAMAASQWQVSTAADFSSTVVSTGDVAGTATSYTLAAGALSVSTVYYWRVRYKDAMGSYSDWSTASSFTSASSFPAYIATPAATPAAFGDSFEGGFYTGQIWNELVQSASSYAIGTGSKAFVVADMTATPLVYAGQTLEVRSRANPVNKMIGVVTGASGTALTINVTSVGGSGTFTDWSIMAQYRVIVAPKATGENTAIAYKNANTAAPAACGTLSEGRKATLAMVAADTSTVYPAAHWCNNLSIAGKTDWYLPARDELELCWRNLKPTADANYVTANRGDSTIDYKNLGALDDTVITHGSNNNTSPIGAAYIAGTPAQVAAGKNFRTSESEAFAYGSFGYWSASEYSATYAWYQYWLSSLPGYQNDTNKTNALYVRAVRRSII